jgi:hypothetical protein
MNPTLEILPRLFGKKLLLRIAEDARSATKNKESTWSLE